MINVKYGMMINMEWFSWNSYSNWQFFYEGLITEHIIYHLYSIVIMYLKIVNKQWNSKTIIQNNTNTITINGWGEVRFDEIRGNEMSKLFTKVEIQFLR